MWAWLNPPYPPYLPSLPTLPTFKICLKHRALSLIPVSSIAKKQVSCHFQRDDIMKMRSIVYFNKLFWKQQQQPLVSTCKFTHMHKYMYIYSFFSSLNVNLWTSQHFHIWFLFCSPDVLYLIPAFWFTDFLRSVHAEWQWPLSCVHSIMMEKLVQPFTKFTITYKVVLYAPANRAYMYTPSISTLPLYVLCGCVHTLGIHSHKIALVYLTNRRSSFSRAELHWNWIRRRMCTNNCCISSYR